MQTELASLVLVHEDDKENRTCHNLPKGCKTESKCVIQCHSPLEEDTNEALLLKAKYRWNYQSVANYSLKLIGCHSDN